LRNQFVRDWQQDDREIEHTATVLAPISSRSANPAH
jgi:hypothetical protein